jgi:predicted TIM-barrel fold metal-dependent hydrolase
LGAAIARLHRQRGRPEPWSGQRNHQQRREDARQHLLPPRYASWIQDKGARPGGVNLPRWSRASALRFMDGYNIQTRVLSRSTAGVYFGDTLAAQRWACEIIEYSAAVVSRTPDRFGFFATVNLPDVDGIVLVSKNDRRSPGDRR